MSDGHAVEIIDEEASLPPPQGPAPMEAEMENDPQQQNQEQQQEGQQQELPLPPLPADAAAGTVNATNRNASTSNNSNSAQGQRVNLSDLTSFSTNPIEYLQTVASKTFDTTYGLQYLSGHVASTVRSTCLSNASVVVSNTNNRGSSASPYVQQLCLSYLQACAAQNWVTAVAVADYYNINSNESGIKGSSSSNSSNNKASVFAASNILDDVMSTIGWIVSQQCLSRSQIISTGILNSFAALDVSCDGTGNTGNKYTFTKLKQLHVEFLQVCIATGYHRFASSRLAKTWPVLHSLIPVETVMRYFYLRGIVHCCCQEWNLALRCLKQCLLVSVDTSIASAAAAGHRYRQQRQQQQQQQQHGPLLSAIAVEAWKKHILVQCLVRASWPISQRNPLQLPSGVSQSLSRYLQSSGDNNNNRVASSTTASAMSNQQSSTNLSDVMASSQLSADNSDIAIVGSGAGVDNAISSMVGSTTTGSEMHVVETDQQQQPQQQLSQQDTAERSSNSAIARATSAGNSVAISGSRSPSTIRAYTVLANMFMQTNYNNNNANIYAHVFQNKHIWNRDGNTGLVYQVLQDAWPRKLLYDYSRLYASSTLQDLHAAMTVNGNLSNITSDDDNVTICSLQDVLLIVQRISLADNWPIRFEAPNKVYFGKTPPLYTGIEWDEYITLAQYLQSLEGSINVSISSQKKNKISVDEKLSGRLGSVLSHHK